MLDFYKIRETKRGTKDSQTVEVSPVFLTTDHKDLMIRGGAFYAVWDEERGLWSTDIIRVQKIIDRDLRGYAEQIRERHGIEAFVRYMLTDSWTPFTLYLTRLPDNYHPLDKKIIFRDQEVKKTDYASKTLPYPLKEGPTDGFDNLFSVLYDEENLRKLMWAIGSVFTGDSKNIQKFYVLYGPPGTGKSTLLKVLEKLFEGYTTTFEARALGGSGAFPFEAFRENPLIGLDHEGDLSRIASNSGLSSVVSHDNILMNIKHKSSFTTRLDTTLFIATNKPVMISDARSGLLRRMIDISPTGTILSSRNYNKYMDQIEFELGAIAAKCIELYIQLGPRYYDNYTPLLMMKKTNHFFNFVHENALTFEEDDLITLKRAWTMYKEYCDEVGIQYRMNMNSFREELKEYFREFYEIKRINDSLYRSLFIGFKRGYFEKTYSMAQGEENTYDWLELLEHESIFDKVHKNQPAQLANSEGTPRYKWDGLHTKLIDIKTTELHYVLPVENLITIDFDLKDEHGHKSLEKNIEAARAFPPTYAELSKSGLGLHLHYYYDGNVEELSSIFDEGIEILRPVGYFSIRRKLSLCNNHEISTINSGLPLKPKGDTMVSEKTIANERSLRKLILRNLRKEIHPATKPSVDFIDTILKEAFDSGLRYDVTDMKPLILEFASRSTNNADYCIKLALKMPYKSAHEDEEIDTPNGGELAFFDLEVYPNLLLICWKKEGPEATITSMLNPSPEEVGWLLKMNLVGYNNRRYDNHILYGAYLGYDNQHIYELSSRIISGDRTAYFRDAYGLSYADVYDYASKKQSLKHWEVELGLPYYEMDIPWDEPIPEELIPKVIEYCKNDLLATEAVHNHRIEDFHAREILAELSGLRVNDPTMSQAARIIFGKDRDANKKFVYPDLALEFPGYTFDRGESHYRGEIVGEGGYVYAEPGMYNNVVYLDVASMHPTSLEVMNLFGPYTERFSDLKRARILIKEGQLEEASKMFGGVLAKYLTDSESARGLSYALKIILNSVYGFTAAKFDNPFRDIRNKDNVVAKRGALFMVDLKNALQERGSRPIHFKTDSVKIADYTQEDIDFVIEFGKKYGYDFGIEAIYDRMVLINDAVLIGKKDDGTWDPVGARFAHPYVFKTLFTKEPLVFEDLVEVRSVVKGAIYIETAEEELSFVGRIGSFCPMQTLGGALYRVQDDKKYALTGTKGYSWMRSDVVRELQYEDDIDMLYFKRLADEALEKIAEFGDPTLFIGDDQ